jgi:hypothetical protein
MTQDQIVPSVPSVYREDGYLVLTLRARAGEVLYYSTREGGKSISLSFPRFMERMQIPDPPANPYRMMLNILAQVQIGTLRLRVREERRIVSMLEKSRDELLKLDPAKLGEEYARIVGKTPPPESTADQLVKELLMNVKAEVEKKEDKESKDGTQAAQPSAPAEGASTPAAPAPRLPHPRTRTRREQGASRDHEEEDPEENREERRADQRRPGALRSAEQEEERRQEGGKKKDAKKPAEEREEVDPAAAKPAKTAKKVGTMAIPFRPGSKKADLLRLPQEVRRGSREGDREGHRARRHREHVEVLVRGLLQGLIPGLPMSAARRTSRRTPTSSPSRRGGRISRRGSARW